MRNDRLLQIFFDMLSQTHDPNETAAQLIRRVAGAYSLELTQTGEIPLMFLDDVLSDLEAEVLEIYRKKTYGFLTLPEYRAAKASEADHS